MSRITQQLSPTAMASERRFYSRFVPQATVCIAIDGKTDGLLLNISENGLLVSTLTELPCNFVTQTSIPLNGLPKPLQVNVRVVWSSEERMLAGIQLINLSEYDREQIRMWGAQTSNSLPPREINPNSVSTNSPIVAAEKVAAAPRLPGAIGSAAKTLQKTPPVLAPLNSAAMPPQRPTAFADKLVEKPVAAKQTMEAVMASKSEWRKLKWPLIIAVLLLSGLFLLASGALVNPFSHATENRAENDLARPSVLLPEQNPQASLANAQFAQHTPVDETTPPVNNYVSFNKDFETPAGAPAKTLVRDSINPALTRREPVPSIVPVPRINNVQPFTENSRNSVATTQPAHSVRNALQNLRSNSQAASAGKLISTTTVEKPKLDSLPVQVAKANSVKQNKSPSALPPAPTVRKRIPIPPSAAKSARQETVIAPAHQPVESKTLVNSLPSKSAPSSSAVIPDITLLPTHDTIQTDTSRNAMASNGGVSSSPTIAPPNTGPPDGAAAIPARPSIVPPKPAARANSVPSLSPVIQMDTLGRRVVELRASGDETSFVNIPGERMLRSSSVTMHIQRSVRLPEEGSGWLFHRDKEKMVAVGDLVSRVEPQVPASQLAGNDFVQVRARIAEDGSVESVRPLHGAQSLVPVVLNAVRGWHFQATLVDGKAVETQSDVLIQFHPPLSRRARP